MTHRPASLRPPVLCVLLLVSASVIALAGDLDPPAGPIAATMKPLHEVEPRIAINAQNTPGDADSVFRITQGGSYYLTGNVTGEAGKHGIHVATIAPVTLDLGGYALVGVPGSLHGITTIGACTIRNGSVRSWGQAGVHVAEGTVYEIEAHFNGQEGIRGLWGNLIFDCRAELNGGPGISVADVSQIRNCMVKGNLGPGIQLDGACTVSDCVVYNNAGGISGGLATIRDCMLFSNNTFAIRVSGFAHVTGNNITSATSAIEATGDSNRIQDNTIVSAVTGILVSGDANRIEGNTVSRCTTGYDVDGAGNLLIRNTATANATHFDIAPGNSFGPLISVSGAGDISATAGSEHPWANFMH